MEWVNHRFKIVEMIASDAFGDVYVVRDIKRDRLVNMRIFSPEFSQNDLMIHYQVNFVHYSTMIHPNLYKNYKFDIVYAVDGKSQQRKQFYYTYEYDIRQAINYMDLSRQEALEVLTELCAALKYLHYRGYVYKYLNFDHIHIFRNDDGTFKVKLSDLATVQLYRDDVHTEKSYQQFVAPEVFWNERHNAQADIYSLGIVFYYLYHRHSFKNKTVDESLRRNIKSAADKLVAQMIRLSIIDEITSIDEFIKLLSEVFNMKISFDDYTYYNKLQLKAPILERFNERDFFINHVREKFNKNSEINGILIAGDIGTGKSRIIDEAETVLKWQGNRVIRVDCEEGPGYNSLVSLIKSIIEFGDLNQELIIKYGSELVKFLPEYTSIWGVTEAERLEESIEQLRVKNRLYNFLREYSLLHQVIFIFDDINRLNHHQLELINHLMISAKENQYLIIGSYETEVLDSQIDNVWAFSSRVVINQLTNFNYDQASQFVSGLLGVGQNPIELTAKVMRDAHGNLKQIIAIIKELHDKCILYLNENNEWVLDDRYPEIIMDHVEHDVEELSDIPEADRHILEAAALFTSGASMEIMKLMFPAYHESLHEVLTTFESKGVLKRKYDDFGETFDYFSKSLKRNIVDGMNKSRKESLHKQIALIYEQFIDQGMLPCSEEIIHHFSNGNVKEKAIYYCKMLADTLEKKHMYMQSIEIYNRALGILHAHVKSIEIGEIYWHISRIYMLIGKCELAYNFAYKALDISKELSDIEIAAKSMIVLGRLYANKRDVNKCRQFIDGIRDIDGIMDNQSILFEIQLLELEMLANENDMVAIEKLLKTIQPNSATEEGIIKTYLGYAALKKENYSEALSILEEAETLIDVDALTNPIDYLMPSNYIGELYAFHLDEVEKGRDFFKSIIRRAENWNLDGASSVLKRNLGLTYLVEDKLDDAYKAFIAGLSIAEINQNSYMRADLSMHLCKVYLKYENYQKSSFYLKKLESEFEDYYNNPFVTVEFYMIHIEYYLHLKEYDLAAQWCKKLRSANLNIDGRNNFLLKVFEFEVEIFRKQYFNYTANVDLTFVEVLIKAQTNLIETKAVRQLIARLSVNLINYKKYIDVHYLVKLDAGLLDIFNTTALEMKHLIIKGVLSHDRKTFLTELLDVNGSSMTLEEKWLVYKILGDEHYDHYDYYQSIQAYFNAFDVLKHLSDYVPKEHKENYIFCDEVKLDLKSKLNNIHRKLIGHNFKQKTVYAELEVRKADDFFDLTDYKNFVFNKSIQKSISDVYLEKHEIVLDSVNALIQNFGKNEIENIELILKYCTQILIGERGYVFILDDDGRVKEVIKNNPEHDVPDLDRIIKSSVNINKGLLIHSIYDTVINYPFLGEQKGLLCMPIFKRESSKNRRRTSDQEESPEIKGYMYIDAKEAFNNFTEAPFESCLSLLNMLYFFVDNYNLKRISTIDKLTEVYLRSYFEDQFSRLLQKTKINGDSLAVVMLDIDKFKHINDTYGHRKGDEILNGMCQVIKKTIRDSDLVGRYGGEEFILVFPETSKENAFKICEKIRKAVEETSFLKDDKPVTISLGISSYPDLGLVEEELIEKADQALYVSKNNGRNQATLWHQDLGADKLRFDKLAGILEGNISNDTRNVQAIVDLMNITKDDGHYVDKIETILTTVSDICEAQAISLVGIEEDSIGDVYTKFTGDSQIYHDNLVDKDMILKYINKNNAEYFINWNDTSEVETCDIPNWKSLIVSPLVYRKQLKGVLIVSVPISTKEFGFNTTNFVNSVSGVIASIM